MTRLTPALLRRPPAETLRWVERSLGRWHDAGRLDLDAVVTRTRCEQFLDHAVRRLS